MNSDERTGETRGELKLPLALRHGGKPETTLRYELVGEGEDVLLVTGGISAGRHIVASGSYPEPGWWQAQAQSFDLHRYRLLGIDWIGADGTIDLPIDPLDQARAIASLLDHLVIGRVHAFIGSSYGGMVGLQLAAEDPDRLGALLAISASDAAHPFSSAGRALQRQAIALGERSGDPSGGVALARAMAMITYRTPEEFADRFATPPAVSGGTVRVGAQDYLDHQGARHSRRMSPPAYRRLSESIDLHRVDPGRVTLPVTLVAVDSDWLVPTADVAKLAAALPRASFQSIGSRFGHDAFLKEEAQVAAIIAEFLHSLETKA